MQTLTHLLSIATTAIFIENILLAYFLGMCSFLAQSERVDKAMGLGLAVVFVLTITAPINWVLSHYLLREGALAWLGLPYVDLSFLTFICFISVIAAVVQLVEMLMERFHPRLYSALGIFLPLIAVNCAILGVSLFMNQRDYNFVETLVFGFSSGIGWLLAILGMASIREKIACSDIPKNLRGLGITMITTGLMAMGFLCFGGIKLVKEEKKPVAKTSQVIIYNKEGSVRCS
ncbi:MAG: NADH:ubiquinone reductase (Na(+)-transporting) subunit E [Myxococcota bacterium]